MHNNNYLHSYSQAQLDLKNHQLRKVKLENLTLLNMANRTNDGDQVKILEDLLMAEKNKVKLLLEKSENIKKEQLSPETRDRKPFGNLSTPKRKSKHKLEK